jgi:hypothetical protein
MRCSLALAMAILACGRVAAAQPAPAADRGYAELVVQSAFGNVTSQSFGVEAGVTVWPNLQVFVEAGKVRDVATTEIGVAAQTIAGFLSQTQSAVAFSVKEPVTFGVAGVKYLIPLSNSTLRPYVLGGIGIASVSQNVAFTIAGSDVTSSLATSYGVALGTDLSGSFTKPMFVAGGGVMWPAWQRLVVDAQFRFGRILADDGGINVSRAGIGVGVRF